MSFFHSLGCRAACALFVFFAALMSGAEAVELETISGPTMGTSYTVRWPATSGVNPDSIQERVAARLEEINSMMSTFDPESELSRFNVSDSTEWFPVSAETALVVAKGLEISRLSSGAFDPTVGRLVGLWSFGADRRSYVPPDQAAIDGALEAVGAKYVAVRTDPPAIRKLRGDVRLDLSAIAKGYGVDAVSELLVTLGLHDTMVEIGGEVRTRGTKLGHPWTIGIEKPSALPSGLSATIVLRDMAMATSGDYRNYFEKDGVRYSHTIDPQTGRPVTHSLASVSVISADCMTADALATTFMVLGPEKGLQFAEDHEIAAYFLTYTPQGGFAETHSTKANGLFLPVSEGGAPHVGPRGGLWQTLLLTIVVFGLAIVGLAVGVIFSNRRLQGTCGGANGLKDEQGRPLCEMCTTPPEKCDRRRQASGDEARTG